MSTYHLKDTVDRSILLQEAWFRAHTMGLGKVFDWVNPFPIPSIYEIQNRELKRWDQPEAYAWIRDQLVKEALARSIMGEELAVRYGERRRMLFEIAAHGCPKSTNALLEYLEELLELMVDFVILYHLAEDSRTPELVRMRAMQARDEQPLFKQQDEILRSSLLCLYPDLEGVEQVVCYREIKHNQPPKRDELELRMKGWVVVPGEMYEIGTTDEFVKRHPGFVFVA